MRLLDDWRDIIKRAWSIRLIAFAGLLSGCELILPHMIDTMPKRVFLVLSFIVTVLAFIARLMVQPKGRR